MSGIYQVYTIIINFLRFPDVSPDFAKCNAFKQGLSNMRWLGASSGNYFNITSLTSHVMNSIC